jgi:hypothetical protein
MNHKARWIREPQQENQPGRKTKITKIGREKKEKNSVLGTLLLISLDFFSVCLFI